MKKLRSYMAMLMALVIAVTSINIPSMAVYAQDVDEGQAQLATASDAVPVKEGSTEVVISEKGKLERLSFTPSESGAYEFYSTGDSDTYAELYDSDGQLLKSNYDSEDSYNFRILQKLTAGETYELAAGYENSAATGRFTVIIGRIPDLKSIKFGKNRTDYLERIDTDYIPNVCAEYPDTYAFTPYVQVSADKVNVDDLFDYSFSIKAANGSYTYDDGEGNGLPYSGCLTQDGGLPVGTYTEQLTDALDYGEFPDENTVIYDSRQIRILSADEYFAEREDISETTEKQFKVSDDHSEYYRFIPSKTTQYMFTGLKGRYEYTVYDSSYNVVYEDDNNAYSLTAGKSYYVGISGWNVEEDETAAVKAVEYSEPVSVEVTMNSEYPAAGSIEGSSILSGVTAKITYSDNSTDVVSNINDSTFYDNRGNEYTNYLCNKTEEWNAETFNDWDSYVAGEYIFSIGYGDKKLYSGNLKIKRIDEYEWPELKAGQQELMSGESEEQSNYYSFVMPYDGHVSISQSSEYRIYMISSDDVVTGIDPDSWQLKKGTRYYIGFYGYLKDSDTDEEIHVNSWQAKVSFDPAIKKMTAAPAKKKVIRGLDNSYIEGATLNVTYSDGSVEDIVCDEYDVNTKYGQNIEIVYKQGDTTYEGCAYAPSGKLTISFENDYSDKFCSYDVQVYEFNDLTAGVLKVGTNAIKQNSDSSMPTYYKFIAPETAEYSFGACQSEEIYEVYTITGSEDEKEYTYQDASMLDTFGSCYDVKAKLTEGSTYYIKVSDGAKDRWGDIQYTWNMKVTKIKDIIKACDWKLTKEYGDLSFPSGITIDSLGRLLGGVSMEIEYADNSSRTEEWNNRYSQSTNDGYWIRAYVDKEYANGEYEYVADAGTNTGLTQGHYKLVLNIDDEADVMDNLEIPFDIKSIDSSIDGTWDVTKTLSVKNDKPMYIYKLETPADTRALTFVANASGTAVSLVDANGNLLRLVANYDSTYDSGRSWSGDIPADGAYLYIYPSENHPVTKLTTDKVKEAVAVSVNVDDADYYATYNYLKNSNIHVNVKYSDDTEEVFDYYDDDDKVQLQITNAKGESCTADLWLGAGTYKITPSVINMSDDCKVTPAVVTQKSVDTDSLQQLEEGETYTYKNDNSYTKCLFYRYEAPATGKLKVQTGGSLRFYKISGRYDISGEEYNTYQVQKGGSYLIVVFVNPGNENSLKLEYTEYEHESGGSLVLGENKAIKTTTSERQIDYTYTPDASGTYVLSLSYDARFDNIQLCQGSEILGYAMYDSNDRIYKLSAYLKKGVTYTYVVTTYGGEEDTFAIRLDKGNKNPVISSLSVAEDSCVYQDEYFVKGNINVSYSDGSKDVVPFNYVNGESWSDTDKYDNKLQVAVTLLSGDKNPKALIELRYKNNNSDTWVYADQTQVTMTGKSSDEWTDAEIIKQLTAGETYKGTGNSKNSLYFTFIPDEDGQYVVSIDNAYGVVKDLSADDNVSQDDDKYFMKAGHTYGIKLDKYSQKDSDYSITIARSDSVADVEILSYDGKAFSLGGCVNTDRYLKVRVTYADGSTELVNGGERLGDGRYVQCRWNSYDDSKAAVTVVIDGISDRYLVRYSAIENAPKLTFTDNVAKLSGEYDGTSSKEKLVYRITIPQTGEYTTVNDTSIYKGTLELYNLDGTRVDTNENYRYSLEKGNSYYLCGVMYGAYSLRFGLAYDGTWETTQKASCIEPGLMRRKNLLTGVYESKTIPKTDHDYSEWEVTTPAGTTAAGVKKLVCSMCKVESGTEQSIPKIKTITLEKTSYTYDNTSKKPTVTIKDENGVKLGKEAYSVKYTNNKAVGKATVTITFKGDYSGTTKKYFNITPAATAITGLKNTSAGVSITWRKSDSASGYLVYRKTSRSKYALVKTITSNKTLTYVDKKAANGTKYTYMIVARKVIGKASYKSGHSNTKEILRIASSDISKLTNEKGKKLKVTWAKNTKITGYQIQYSTDKKFTKSKTKTITVKGSNVTNKTISGLKKNSRYYVRVRGYKKIDKKTTKYSDWSGSKNCIIKK